MPPCASLPDHAQSCAASPLFYPFRMMPQARLSTLCAAANSFSTSTLFDSAPATSCSTGANSFSTPPQNRPSRTHSYVLIRGSVANRAARKTNACFQTSRAARHAVRSRCQQINAVCVRQAHQSGHKRRYAPAPVLRPPRCAAKNQTQCQMNRGMIAAATRWSATKRVRPTRRCS